MFQPGPAKVRAVLLGRQAHRSHETRQGLAHTSIHLHLGLSALWCHPEVRLRARTQLSTAPSPPTRTTLSPLWPCFRSLGGSRWGAIPTEAIEASPVSSRTFLQTLDVTRLTKLTNYIRCSFRPPEDRKEVGLRLG